MYLANHDWFNASQSWILSCLRLFLVNASRQGKQDVIREFFESMSDALHDRKEWKDWFGMYIHVHVHLEMYPCINPCICKYMYTYQTAYGPGTCSLIALLFFQQLFRSQRTQTSITSSNSTSARSGLIPLWSPCTTSLAQSSHACISFTHTHTERERVREKEREREREKLYNSDFICKYYSLITITSGIWRVKLEGRINAWCVLCVCVYRHKKPLECPQMKLWRPCLNHGLGSLPWLFHLFPHCWILSKNTRRWRLWPLRTKLYTSS